jgi:small membrane protein
VDRFLGILFVIHPELSTRVANLIGIGRGADLVLYCFVIFALFQFVSIASGLKQLERQLAAIVQALAVDRPLGGGPPGPPGVGTRRESSGTSAG